MQLIATHIKKTTNKQAKNKVEELYPKAMFKTGGKEGKHAMTILNDRRSKKHRKRNQTLGIKKDKDKVRAWFRDNPNEGGQEKDPGKMSLNKGV